MKSRSDSSKPLHNQYCPIRHTLSTRPHSHPRNHPHSSRPASDTPDHPSPLPPAPTTEDLPPLDAEPELVLDDEISLAELNQFTMFCIEQLASSNKDQAAELIVKEAITKKLPSYTTLKADFLSSRQAHRSHHTWTKQLIDSVEPLLKSDTAPVEEHQTLSNLALQCVEQSMQLHSRVDQLKRRVTFLEQAVALHLIQVGEEIGFPQTLLKPFAHLVRAVLEKYNTEH